MSSIEKIVEQALRDGYLTPTMEAEVGRICDTAAELSIEEYMALDRLMGALLTGAVVAVPRKQFINVMEELVLAEAISRVAEVESSLEQTLDLADIAAYALNRLPPLYATTEGGAAYQRQRAQEELQTLITAQVQEAIAANLQKPDAPGGPAKLKEVAGSKAVAGQLSILLRDHAQQFDPSASVGGNLA